MFPAPHILTSVSMAIPPSWTLVLALGAVLLVVAVRQRFGRLAIVTTAAPTSAGSTLAVSWPAPAVGGRGSNDSATGPAPAPGAGGDHCGGEGLTPRQRRTAESRRVLAGSGLRSSRPESMPVSDAVYAALGEVEDHERVKVGHLDPASIRGIEAPSLVHVMAELIENALRYSPLNGSVEVGGSLTPAGYTILVRDHGGGMIDHDIVRANQRLAGEDSPGVVPTRYLGHFVAGHLARRMGVAVRLRTTPEGGITACIAVPLTLLARDQTANALIPEPPLMPAPTAAAGRTGGLALFPVGPSMYALVAARRPRGDDAFVGAPAPRRVSV